MDKFKRYFIEINDNLDVLRGNKEFLKYIGKKDLGNLETIMPSEDLMTFKNILLGTSLGGNSLICFRVKNSEGELCWMAATAHKPSDASENIKLDFQDIQSMKMDNSEGYYDSMTGVLSKSAITQYAQALMNQSPRKHFYFFIMDVDNFKAINDTYGHMKGDEVIVDVAKIAMDSVGDKGVVGRIGGDEFVILFEEISEEEELRDYLRKIRYSVRERFVDEEKNYTITVSLGGGLYPDYASNYDEMFKLADKMMYIAKAKGRDRYIIYTPAIHGLVQYEGEVLTLSQHMTQNKEKNTLIMNLMAGFLYRRDISFREAFESIITTYLLDEAYIIDKKTAKSRFGLKVVTDGGEKHSELADIDMTELAPEDYEPFFEEYPIKVVNMFDLQKDGYNKFADYMVRKGYRILVIYYLRNIEDEGYLMYVNTANSACRFSETDFADLTYFSRMLELSGKCP